MKKNNLLILAVAALGFAACTNDETTAVNEKLAESNAISFRANVAGNMRDANAAGVKKTPWENADKIYVNAIRTVSSTPSMYFQSEFNYTTSNFQLDSILPTSIIGLQISQLITFTLQHFGAYLIRL